MSIERLSDDMTIDYRKAKAAKPGSTIDPYFLNVFLAFILRL